MEPCDIECQKNKQLSTLLTTLQQATVNKGVNPEAYEKARLQYYTLKEGQGWLQEEKQKIAKKEIIPVLDSYKQRYTNAQNSINQHNSVQQAIREAQAGEVGDEEEVRFIQKKIRAEQNKGGVIQRLMELQSSPSSSWFTFLDVLIALLLLGVVYMIFNRVTTYTPPPTISTIV